MAESLSSKGRSEQEVRERKEKEKWKVNTMFLEQDFCDYFIANGYDIASKTWDKTKEELLREFNLCFESLLTKQQIQEECYKGLASEQTGVDKVREIYLQERWLNAINDYGIYGTELQGIEGNINSIVGTDRQVQRQLGAEYHMQRWLDKIWMNEINSEIIRTTVLARKGVLTENDMNIRTRLKSQYESKWAELENPDNELVTKYYNGLVNIVPLADGETEADRIKFLRYLYRDPNQREYREEESLLKRRLVEISCPYEYSI